MKSTILKALCIGPLLAQTGGMVNFGSGPNLSKEIQSDEANTSKASVEQAVAGQEGRNSKAGSSEIMIINPSERAKDFQEVYQYLQNQRNGSAVTFTLKNGSTISNIQQIYLPQNGSILIFKTSTRQGLRYQVVKVEDIVSVTQS